jgi:hypothetical protein
LTSAAIVTWLPSTVTWMSSFFTPGRSAVTTYASGFSTTSTLTGAAPSRASRNGLKKPRTKSSKPASANGP